jgi:hypothetical protein
LPVFTSPFFSTWPKHRFEFQDTPSHF